jgi:hypothetical protein
MQTAKNGRTKICANRAGTTDFGMRFNALKSSIEIANPSPNIIRLRITARTEFES